MSKAFTSEENEIQDVIPTRVRPMLPPGTKNYLTRNGAEAFKAELLRFTEERATLVNSPAEGAKERLLRVDTRLRELEEIITSATVIDAPPTEQDRVRFGATVEVQDQNGEKITCRIVGLDEVDIDRDWISWLSPLAKALMNKRVGEAAEFTAPGGKRRLVILGLNYD